MTGQWSESRFLSFDETPIFYRRLRPSLRPKAKIVIVHGFGEHSGRYVSSAEYFGELPCEVFAADLRGFGQSGGKRACVRSFSDYLRDLEALHRLAVEEKDIPVFILGHSLGGLIASTYASSQKPLPLKGLVLSSPYFGLGFPVPGWKRFVGLAGSYFFPDVSLATGIDPKNLTHDAEAVRRYESDPLIVHRSSLRFYRETRHAITSSKTIASRIGCPVLIVQAGEERVVSKEAVYAFYDRLKTPFKEIEVYGGFYHEVLNEIDRLAALSRVSAWLLRHAL